MTLLGRMALIALVIGTSVTVSATERVTLSLVLAGWIGWSFVPAAQLATGLFLIRGTKTNRIDALDRYFRTHWAWSLWILVAHAAYLMWPPARSAGLWIALTAGLPLIMTIRLLDAFCQEALGMDRRTSRRAVALHQVVTYTLVLGYVSTAVALWPRIAGLFA